MRKFRNFIDLLFTKKFISKFIAYFLLVAVFYLFKDFLWIFLLTFIFAYLFLALAEFMKAKINLFLWKYFKHWKVNKFLKKFISLNLLIVIIYILFIWMIVFLISDLIPTLINELSELPKNLPFLAEPISSVTNKLVEIKNFNAEIGWTFSEVITNKDIEVVIDILWRLKTASFIFLQIILSLLLSFVFLLDRFRLNKYLLWIKKSSFNFLHKEYKIIFEKIVKSFGLIFKAQSMIALINCILTVIWLIIIWLIHWGTFPYLLTIWLIVFIAWFIPVLWVFLSSIPIIIIAYSIIWWFPVLIEIILLVVIVHIIEAYYLNPKIVSRFLEIPVSLTFIILIVSEHLFGIAWLLIWVSMFYFIVWLLRDIDETLKKNKKKLKRERKIIIEETIEVNPK
jgi:predicted PurR-regulated permease PerM